MKAERRLLVLLICGRLGLVQQMPSMQLRACSCCSVDRALVEEIFKTLECGHEVILLFETCPLAFNAISLVIPKLYNISSFENVQ